MVSRDMQSRDSASSVIAPDRVVKQRSIAREKAQDKAQEPKIEIEDLSFYYGRLRALRNISLAIPPNRVTAFIGPSGCGKSTLIRTLNRMNDVIPGTRVEGRVEIDGENIYAPGIDVVRLRQRVGMVFQKPNPFPRSIFDNVAYGIKINALTRSKSDLARATIARDDEVDSLYDQFYAQLIDVMQRDSSTVARGAQWLFVLKHLERIADYVTNICEQIVYMARGQVIKHKIW